MTIWSDEDKVITIWGASMEIDRSPWILHRKISIERDQSITVDGLDKLSRLSNLELLDLGVNMFNNDILPSLGLHFRLQNLYLLDNEIDKVVFPKGPGARSSLQTLYLDSNKLNKIIDFQDNLEYLDLRGNKLNSSMLSSIGALSSLKTLYLNDKGLRGIVDIAGFYSLSNLEFLDMSNNEIDKFIFPKDGTSLKGLTELYLVNISIRDGSSLLRSLGSFSSLKKLDLRFNNFSETTTTANLPYLRNLTSLYMDDTNLGINFLQIFKFLGC
ncbi:hypothetical protein Ddye_028694 [Dipteronia dyeriana]|uniref:Chaoptin n=1 Tax=Dipteronia dyeriana TaxID=168575 RepID=A0AAD9WKT5_9ROSI|nr:hypothetical protein Ddye_028694 [Dipteronia dyeriana]